MSGRMNEDDDIQAAEYVLGLTDAAASAATHIKAQRCPQPGRLMIPALDPALGPAGPLCTQCYASVKNQ